jgi:hypothetical protein
MLFPFTLMKEAGRASETYYNINIPKMMGNAQDNNSIMRDLLVFQKVILIDEKSAVNKVALPSLSEARSRMNVFNPPKTQRLLCVPHALTLENGTFADRVYLQVSYDSYKRQILIP